MIFVCIRERVFCVPGDSSRSNVWQNSLANSHGIGIVVSLYNSGHDLELLISCHTDMTRV